jgi:signal transduction histidine kinase/ActR/RegA family two-component response regulator
VIGRLHSHFLFLWNGGVDPAQDDLGDLRERRILFSTVVLLLPVCLLVMFANWRGGEGGDNYVLSCGLILGFSVLYIQSYLQFQRVAANLVLFAYWVMPTILMQSYGLQGTTMMWILPVPAVAILLTGRKIGMAWGLLSAMVILVTGYLHANSLIDYRSIDHEFAPEVGITNAIEGVLIMAILLGTAFIFRRTQREAESKLNNTVNRLEKEVINKRHAEEDSKRSEQSKSAFLSAMSHEIRTPLNGVITATRLMVDAKTDAERREYAEIVLGSSDTLLELVSDVMDLNALEAGSFKIALKAVLVRDVFQTTLRPFYFQAEEKGIALNLTIARDVPKYFLGDKTRAKQILMNLTANAIKFTEKGSVSISAAFENNMLVVVVTDTGVGIAKESLDKLFEPFVQENSSTRSDYGGSGLGLAIVKKTITAMRGRIQLESELGIGTKVSVYFPYIEASKQSIMAIENSMTVITEIPPMNLLIADDNAVNRMVLSRLLENDNHTVVSVEDGQQALDYVKAHSVDAVLMDIQMPVMSGEEAAAEIRRLAKPDNEVPIIAITANTNSGDAQRLLDADFDGFLSKPFRREDLVRILQQSCLDKPTEGSRQRESQDTIARS